MKFIFSFCLSIMALAMTTCKTVSHQSTPQQTSAPVSSLDRCFGYRGNGSSVFATIGGIARLFDQFGSPAAVFGTSSGSVAAFLTESVMVPNAPYACNGCSAADIAERRSFMLKAFPLLMNAMAESDGMVEDFRKIKVAKEIYAAIMKLNLMPAPGVNGGVSENKWLSSVEVKQLLNYSALTVLNNTSRELKYFINPEYYKISGIGGQANPVLVDKAIENVISFQGEAKENKFQRQNLMMPGVVHFNHIFKTIGVLADFYAGYGSEYPKTAMNALLLQCAKSTRGIWWNDIAAKPFGTSTCGNEYYRLMSTYFNSRKKNTTDLKRIDEKIGTYIPAFVSTSAIGGNEIVASMSQFADAGEYDRIDALNLGRENFKVLYFGSADYKGIISANKKMFNDVITNNIVSMGAVSWLTAIKASGQEPATDRAGLFSEAGQNYLATGGYVDQLQSKIMRMAGCSQNIVINTNSPILGFANRYAPRTWNLDKNLVGDMLDPEDPHSSESLGFTQTSALLCSRWDSYGLKETWEMADNSYFNYIFTDEESLLAGSESFFRKNGEQTTKRDQPKACYALKSERSNQFEAYKP